MSVSERISREGAGGVGFAGVLVSLLIGLTALLLPSCEAVAHPVHAAVLANQTVSSDVTADAAGKEEPTGLVDRSSPTGLGGGCSLAGLEVPRLGAPRRAAATGIRMLPISMKPARDVALPPPCPPPTPKLRVTLD